MVKRSNPNQFQLRLPPGLRERIKAYADAHGRSMNAAIVEVLEREFPEPWTLEQRIHQLSGALAIMREAEHPKELVDQLVENIRDTLEGIVTGRVMDVDEPVRQEVRQGLERWREEIGERRPNRPLKPLDPERIKAIQQSLPEKF